jgi:phosphinothricin acetyltransferase
VGAITLRTATNDDAAAINTIYNQLIEATHVSFDTEPWSDEERRRWIDDHPGGRHRVLVAEAEGRVVGFAASGPYRSKVAYETSVESTVCLLPAEIGRGVGRRLMTRLLDDLAAAGAHRAYAIVALPNDPSVAFHLEMGFRSLGIQHEVGRKFGRYWSTELFEYRFGE